MRWLLLLVSVAGFAAAFKSVTPGSLALWLLVAFGALVASFLAFAAARIESQSQTQSSRAATLVATSMGKRRAAASTPAASTSDGATWSPGHDRHDGGFAGDTGGGDSGGGDGGGGGGSD
jgi:hypothetical protein